MAILQNLQNFPNLSRLSPLILAVGCLETSVTVNYSRSLWLFLRFQLCFWVYSISVSMTDKLRVDLRVSQLQTSEPQSSEILSLALSVVRPVF